MGASTEHGAFRVQCYIFMIFACTICSRNRSGVKDMIIHCNTTRENLFDQVMNLLLPAERVMNLTVSVCSQLWLFICNFFSSTNRKCLFSIYFPALHIVNFKDGFFFRISKCFHDMIKGILVFTVRNLLGLETRSIQLRHISHFCSHIN